MKKLAILAFAMLGSAAFAQTVSVTANTTISGRQNALSAYNFNNVLWVDGVKFTTISAAYAACPVGGGVVHVPPGYVENPFVPIDAKANCVIVFDGTATLTSGSTLFTNTNAVPGFGLIGPANNPLSSGNGNNAAAVKLIYTGAGTALNLGTSGSSTSGLQLDNIMVDITGARSAAVGVHIISTNPCHSQGLTVQGSQAGANTQIGLQLDGGTVSFTGCQVDDLWIGGTNTGIQFTGSGFDTANFNHITKANVAALGAAPKALDFQGGNGNWVEVNSNNEPGTLVNMANLATNSSNHIEVYNCNETTFATIAGSNAGYNEIVATGGCSIVGKVSDSGTGDTIYNRAQGFRTDPSGNTTFTGWIHGANGAESAPTYSFTSGTGTGVSRQNARILGFTSNGTYSFLLGFGLARFGSAYTLGFSPASDPANGNTDTAYSRCGVNVHCFGNGTQGDASGTVKSAGVESNTSNPATTGFIQRANADEICSRDSANGSNHCFGEIQYTRRLWLSDGVYSRF